MKNYLAPLFLFLFLSLGITVSAQNTDVISIQNYELDEKNEVVRISIQTEESFIIGANRYVLHIGGKPFLRNEHPDGHLDEIVFLIPLSEFESIEENKEIVLVYGLYHENTLQDGEGSQVNGFTGMHWRLGKFTKPTFPSR